MRNFVNFLMLLLFALSTLAQSDWSFGHITTDDGLSTGTANCVFKDSKGFVWIGTVDGLNRYDGYEITVFKNRKDDPTSLVGNIIEVINEGPEGNIWVGTRTRGLCIFDWSTGQFSGLPIAENSNHISAIEVTNDSKVMIGSRGGGLAIYDPKSEDFNILTSENSQLSNDTIYNIIPGSSNEHYISSNATAIDVLNTATMSFQPLSYDPNYEPAESTRKPIMLDSKNVLWIGTDGNGVIRYDVASGNHRLLNTNNSGLRQNIITTIYEGQDGLIYIGNDGFGINILNERTEQFTYLESSLLDPGTLSSNAIYQIKEDNSGVIWVSTYRGGVNVYSPNRNKFKLYKQIPHENNSLSFQSVVSVLEGSEGYIWIGTDGGGLDKLNPSTGTFEHFQHDPNDPTSISTDVAISLLEDSRNNLWIGTYSGGLNRMNKTTGRFQRYLPDPTDPTSLNSKNVWTMLEDSEGTLWFGLLNGGLERYNPATNSFEHFVPSSSTTSISSNLVFSLLEDSKKNFWVGTQNGGLNLFDRESETFMHFKSDENDTTTLLSNEVKTLFEDSRGQVWVGTSLGANLIDPVTKELSKAYVNKLLPNLVINGIQEDEKGNLWFATNRGLSRYNPADRTILNFSMSDGLQGIEFNKSASVKTTDGTMYFGGVRGLNSFRPSEVILSDYNPALVLTEIKLFDEPIENPLQTLTELTLRHDQNVLGIGFSSLDFTSPNANKYRYKLEGFDDEWMYTDASKRSASYTNLDADTYTFIVEGTNSDGIWSSKSKELVITVLPPWWQTWWFRVVSILIVLGGIFVFTRWRSLAIRRQKEELRRQVEEATSVTREQNLVLQREQSKLEEAIAETNQVVGEALESGNFSARINLENKEGAWKDLGQSINSLFDSIVLPFQNINEIVGAMASSNLTIRYTDEAKGDILKMTSSLNYALYNLSMLISTIKQTTTVILQSSNEKMVSSDKMRVGTDQIAASTSKMISGAQEQVGKIDEASEKQEETLYITTHTVK